MRLIDADALMYSRVRIAHDDGTIGGYNAVVMSSEINHAPAIEAIPVEWIKDYADELIRLEGNNYFIYGGLGDYGKGLLEVIKKWREEKEGDES